MKHPDFFKIAAFYLALGLAGGFTIGYLCMPEKIIEVEVQTVREITPIDSPDLLREFSSEQELDAFVHSWRYTPSIPDITDTGKDRANDCDDFSIQFVQDAARRGYLCGLFFDPDRKHLLNCTIVGNRLYFIEPQTGLIEDSFNGTAWALDD